MKVATLKTADGSEQDLSLSNGTFTLGQNPITKEQVIEYDNLGVLKWENGEVRNFALGNLSYQTSPQSTVPQSSPVLPIAEEPFPNLWNGLIRNDDYPIWRFLGRVMFSVWLFSSFIFAFWWFSMTTDGAWIFGFAVIPVISIFIGLWTFTPLLLLRVLVNYQLKNMKL